MSFLYSKFSNSYFTQKKAFPIFPCDFSTFHSPALLITSFVTTLASFCTSNTYKHTTVSRPLSLLNSQLLECYSQRCRLSTLHFNSCIFMYRSYLISQVFLDNPVPSYSLIPLYFSSFLFMRLLSSTRM